MNKHEALSKIKELEFELSELKTDNSTIKGEFGRLKTAYKQSKKLISKMRNEYTKLKITQPQVKQN